MQTSNSHLPAICIGGNLLTITAGATASYKISDLNESDETPSVMMSVHSGTATLTGWVDDNTDKTSLEYATQRLNGIEKVENYLMVCH